MGSHDYPLLQFFEHYLMLVLSTGNGIEFLILNFKD